MDFAIIGNSWAARADNPTSKHQVALALAQKGHKVLWVDGAGMRRPSLSSGGDRAKILQKLSRAFQTAQQVEKNIWRISPLILPLPSSSPVRRLNEKIYPSAIRRSGAKLGLDNAVLINFLPTIPGVMRDWNKTSEARRQRLDDRVKRIAGNEDKGLASIYYCVDRWDKFGTYDSKLMAKLDAECCSNADLVIASAQDLYGRCRKHNDNTHLIPHGVDHAHFARVVKDKSISHRGHRETQRGAQTNNKQPTTNNCTAKQRIGFFGLISEWVDQDLLLKLAEIENCEVLLAGKADVNTEALAEKENVKLVGPVPYAELPELIATFDVGIIPFEVNDLTKAVNPIKLREMLAAGCPVISTDLPEVRKLAEELPEGSVSVSKDREEFVRLVREQLDRKLSIEDRTRISNSVKDQDWSAKVDQILVLLKR